MEGLLSGKRILIVGLLNEHSMAYGIAQAMYAQGAQLAFSYQEESVRERVEKLIKRDFGSSLLFPCDVRCDQDIQLLFEQISAHWGYLDGLVHSVAYAPPVQLQGDYLEHIDREGFQLTHEISSYSFVALGKAARALMQGRHGALLTVSYLGARRAIRNYNIMGVAKASLEANVRYMAASLGPEEIRVNAVSPGPVRTVAALGIKDFSKSLKNHQKAAPLRQPTTLKNVGHAAVFLCSDWALGITGEVLYVDGGFHAVCAASELSAES